MTLTDFSVLCVEDGTDIREALAEMLRGRVGTIYRAKDGMEGLSLYSRYNPDIVVTDIRMPGMDGLTMASKIREISKSAQILVISAHSDVSSFLEAIEIGINRYLIRPLKEDTLLAALEKCAETIESEHIIRNQNEMILVLTRAIDQSTNMVMITGTDGTIKYVNPAFCAVTGYAAGEVAGKTPSFLKSGLTPSEVYDNLWKTILSGNDWRGEFRNRRKNGELYWDRTTISPVRNDAGKTTHYIAVKEDCTERKALEEEITKVRDDALRASEHKSQFVSTISHELRTPLNGIIGMVEILLDGHLDAEQKEIAGVVRDSADALLDIINEILDFSKIEAGKLSIERIPFDLATVVGKSIELLTPRCRRKNLSISFFISPDVPRIVLGDPLRLRQIILNLAGNAVKFTEEGGVTVSVNHNAETAGPDEGNIVFTVQDTGIGMPESVLDRLFHPFEQADKQITRRFGGTGLGLSIVRRLIDLMGGVIGVNSLEGRGSAFTFSLPLPEAAADDVTGGYAPAFRQSDCATGFLTETAAVSGSSLLVLVAEDNPVNQKAAQLHVSRLGYRVHIVPDGLAAVEAASTLPCAAILMDCHMPVMDGFEATRKIRAQEFPTGRHIPIIAFTAGAMEEERKSCLESGMDDILIKPVRREDLSKTLERWIGKAPEPGSAEPDKSIRHSPQVLSHPEGETQKSLPVLDLTMLRQTCEDDETLREILLIFTEAAPAMVTGIEDAIAAQDAKELRFSAHRFKGSSLSIGAGNLTSALLRLEHFGIKGDISGARASVGEMKAAYLDVINFIENITNESSQ